MVRASGTLTALKVTRTRKPGIYGDGGGLYLQVAESGAKSWLFRFMLNGRARAMGLGSARTIILADARAKSGECRRLLQAGLDPIEARKAQREAADLEAAKSITFAKAAEAYITAHRVGWSNAKHAAQWAATLDRYVIPVFGAMPVQQVDATLVMKALEPIWTNKVETASRVRGRIEAVLDWAAARGYRRGENPARWRGHLQNLLPRRSKVRRVEHHPALPYSEIGEFMASLRLQEGVAARALEFLILTATRTSETIGARWSEIDLSEAIWIVPPTRIKAGKEHRVPISSTARAVLNAMRPAASGADAFVFPGGRRGRALSNMALSAVLKRMGRADLTVHGFRSSIRDWAAEQTNYPREVAEMALAHAVGDKVEAAYRRGDLFQKRRCMMDEWARFCGTARKGGKVVPIRRRNA
jgi:integrase